MDAITINGIAVAITDKTVQLNNTQDMLDAIVSAHYLDDCQAMIIYKESLPERFFDLKSGFAGEVLQKFSNYRTKLAIAGNFSSFTSKSLKDFMYECNKGNLVFFKDDVQSALNALAGCS